MVQALKEAKKAHDEGEIPVGAVIVKEGKIIARGHNKRVKSGDIFSHAEMLALKKASKKIGDWRLSDCEMFVTLEPCAMCLGAAINARIKKIYFGAYDEKGGCCGSVADLTKLAMLNHKTEAEGGIMQEQCSLLLKDFFAKRRLENKRGEEKTQGGNL